MQHTACNAGFVKSRYKLLTVLQGKRAIFFFFFVVNAASMYLIIFTLKAFLSLFLYSHQSPYVANREAIQN